ncbi:two-component system regulatory protein YycI [Thalassobacillus hwangdonensis]|uniref:Two-component system regulatory protein YycI n=1 Tax=Thalassobacillus hwangdonensis TaxID=546108 RepID=A0ABW3L0Y2_9BACI
MQWGQIKTLFILSFLIVDIFLLNQLLDKRFEVTESFGGNDTPLAEQMEADDIDVSAVPSDTPKASYLTLDRAEFTEDDKTELDQIDGLNARIYNDDLIAARFEEPIPIDEDASREEIMELVNDTFLYNDLYSYWGWNKAENVLMFFQKSKGSTVYFNESGMIMFLVEKGEIVGYVQTRLKPPNEEDVDEKELIPPISAVYLLYTRNHIVPGDEVTDVTLGYHSKIKPELDGLSRLQIFAPVYKVTINNEKELFLNATPYEGIIEMNESEFIKQTKEKFTETIQSNNGPVVPMEDGTEQ